VIPKQFETEPIITFDQFVWPITFTFCNAFRWLCDYFKWLRMSMKSSKSYRKNWLLSLCSYGVTTIY